MADIVVLKLGGELLENAAGRTRLAREAAAIARTRPLVIVHGGGRAIDAELHRRQIVPSKVDGLRVTDAATLEAVVAVLAGSANTDLVAALVTAGVAAVGLTGVDAGMARARRSGAHRSTSGEIVDLGLVGDPEDIDPRLVESLLAHDYVPVIASLGIEDGATPMVLNVNADVMACRLAAAIQAADLLIAGATPGVLDEGGRSIAVLDGDGIDAMVSAGSATAGMIAKLIACRSAVARGVSRVRIVDGRSLGAEHRIDDAPGTSIVETRLAVGARYPGISEQR